MRLLTAAALLCGLTLAACSPQSSRTSDSASAPSENTASDISAFADVASMANSVDDPKGSCNAEIGEAQAQTLSNRCHSLSQVDASPCDPRNTCASIRAEIDRLCKAKKESTEACSPSAPGY